MALFVHMYLILEFLKKIVHLATLETDFFFFSFLLWDISSYQKALMILYTSFSCLFAWGRGDIELLLREGFSTSGQSNNLCLTLTKWNPNINILSHTL